MITFNLKRIEQPKTEIMLKYKY